MTITIGNTGTSGDQAPNVTYEISHTVSADTDVLVFTGCGGDSSSVDRNITGVSSDVDGTFETGFSYDDVGNLNVEVWYLRDPTATSHTITVTHGGKCDDACGFTIDLKGVDTDTPEIDWDYAEVSAGNNILVGVYFEDTDAIGVGICICSEKVVGDLTVSTGTTIESKVDMGSRVAAAAWSEDIAGSNELYFTFSSADAVAMLLVFNPAPTATQLVHTDAGEDYLLHSDNDGSAITIEHKHVLSHADAGEDYCLLDDNDGANISIQHVIPPVTLVHTDAGVDYCELIDGGAIKLTEIQHIDHTDANIDYLSHDADNIDAFVITLSIEACDHTHVADNVVLKGVNVFSSDIRCVALYKFEDGSLTVDSQGNNTLSPTGTPTADTTDRREGSSSVELDVGDYYSVSDGSLDDGFPLKSGDTKKEISVVGWLNTDTIPTANPPEYGWRCVLSKWTVNKYSFALFLHLSGNIYLGVGHSGGTGDEYKDTGGVVSMSTSQWYHVGATFKDSDKSYKIRVWDEDAATVYEVSGNFTNNINVEDESFKIGTSKDGVGVFGNWDGLLDEIVVFNDILSSAEIDLIRTGFYDKMVLTVDDAYHTHDADKILWPLTIQEAYHLHDADSADLPKWCWCNDDFTGSDSDPPGYQWTVSGGDPDIQSNKLSMTTAGGGESVTLTKTVSGDFNAQVDFDITTFPTTNTWVFMLMARIDADHFAQFYASYDSGKKFFATYENGGAPFYDEDPRTNNSGKLKIIRSGSTFYLYYRDGSGPWTLLDGQSYSLGSGDVELALGVNRWGGTPTAIGTFDNFVIHEGCPDVLLDVNDAYHLLDDNDGNPTTITTEEIFTLVHTDGGEDYLLHDADYIYWPDLQIINDAYHLHDADPATFIVNIGHTDAGEDYLLHDTDNVTLFSIHGAYHLLDDNDGNPITIVPVGEVTLVHTDAGEDYLLHDAGHVYWPDLQVINDAYHLHDAESIDFDQHFLAVAECYHLVDDNDGSAIDLGNITLETAAECYHLHDADNIIWPDLQVINSTYHLHYSDNVAWQDLTIEESYHDHIADAANLIVTLDVNSADHLHDADNVIWPDIQVIDSTYHPHDADGAPLTEHHILTVLECYHIHAPPNVDVEEVHFLANLDTFHLHEVDTISLTYVLTISECYHLHDGENVVLVPLTGELVIQEAVHVLESDQLDLTGKHLLTANECYHAHIVPNLSLVQISGAFGTTTLVSLEIVRTFERQGTRRDVVLWEVA